MVLRLHSLELHNFKTYQHATFEFTEGHNVIIGENGAGKSSIFEAIVFSFFGQISGRSTKTLIRHGTRKLEAKLQFSIDGNRYLVKRTLTQSKPTAALFKMPGTHLMAEKSRAVRSEIEKLLDMTFSSFNNVIYIPQGQISAIASELPSERKKLFDKMLGYYLYKKAFIRLRVVAKTAEQRISSLEERISDMEADLEKKMELEDDIAQLEHDLNQHAHQLDELEPKLKEFTTHFQELETQLKTIDKLEERLKTQENELQERENQFNQQNVAIQKLLDQPLPEEDVALDHLLATLTQEQQRLEGEITILTEEVDAGKTLDTSLQNLKDQHKELLQQEKKQTAKINQIIDKIDVDISTIEQRQTYITQLKQDLEDAHHNKTSAENHLETLRSKINEKSVVEEKLASHTTALEKNAKKIQSYRQQLTQLHPNWENEIKSLSEQDYDTHKSNYLAKVKETRAQYTNFEGSIRSLHDQIDQDQEVIAQLNATDINVCPLCDQPISEVHKNDILTEKQVSITAKQTKVQTMNREKINLQEQIQDLEKEIQALEDQEKLVVKLDALHQELQDQLEQRSTLETQLAESKDKLATFGDLKQEVKEKTTVIKQVDELISRLNEHQKLIEQIQIYETQIKEIQDSTTQITQKIDEIEEQSTLNQLASNTKKLQETQEKHKKILDLIPRIEGISNEKRAIIAAHQALQKTTAQLQEQQTSFNREEFDKNKNKVEQYTAKQIEIETLVKSIAKTQIPDKKKQLQDIKKKEKKLTKIKKEHTIARKKYAAVTTVRQFTKEIVPFLRHQHVQAISEYATELFDYLMNNEEYEGLEVTEEYELFVRQTGQRHDITILSGGEQVISCLAIRLAIAKMLADQDILLLDEPTVMLDTYRRKELVEVFEKTKPVRQTIIVTHDTEFERVADSTFTIVKEVGRARVIAEEVDELLAQQKRFRTLTQKRFQQLEI